MLSIFDEQDLVGALDDLQLMGDQNHHLLRQVAADRLVEDMFGYEEESSELAGDLKGPFILMWTAQNGRY